MYFDATTIGSIIVVVVIVGAMLGMQRRAASETHERLQVMEKQLTDLHTGPPIHSREMRELCAAIHHLHPNAVSGVDFQLADEGTGPYIKVWMMDTPEPAMEDLLAILDEHREEWNNESHREARIAEYPSIGDQLDALYKARQGDDTELLALDARITEVKRRHPNMNKC